MHIHIIIKQNVQFLWNKNLIVITKHKTDLNLKLKELAIINVHM